MFVLVLRCGTHTCCSYAQSRDIEAQEKVPPTMVMCLCRGRLVLVVLVVLVVACRRGRFRRRGGRLSRRGPRSP